MSDSKHIETLENEIRILKIQLAQAQSSPAGIESKLVHDLNGALAVAQGQAHMALLNIAKNSKAKISVEEICKACQKALSLVNQIYQNSQENLPDSPQASQDASCRGEGTVFFIDDEEDMRAMVERVLTYYGYKVILASDGFEALELFSQQHAQINLVFMDMTMPRLNGLETFIAMRQLDPSIPIVMTSGYSEINLSETWSELGMNGFLRKPCDLQTLLLTIKDTIRK